MASAQSTGPDYDALDLLRHDLKSPLTIIRGQAQLLRRRVARFDGLDESDRVWLMERSAHIEAAVLLLVDLIDGIGQGPRKRPVEDNADERARHEEA
jgi:signal transduction histidine kinase